jgi:hypothetical protein
MSLIKFLNIDIEKAKKRTEEKRLKELKPKSKQEALKIKFRIRHQKLKEKKEVKKNGKRKFNLG